MSDALERLRNRNRPFVPNRDASLTPGLSVSTSLDIATSGDLQKQTSESPVLQVSQPMTVREPLIEVEEPLKTKQTTLRLEQGVSDRLQNLCREYEICREALIEAMFEYCEGHPNIVSEVLAEATAKNEQRHQIANQKRAKSMMRRFLNQNQ